MGALEIHYIVLTDRAKWCIGISNMNTHTHIVIRQPALVADCASAKLKGVININLKILKSTFGKVGAAGSGMS